MSELVTAYQYNDITKQYVGETVVQKCPYTGELLLPSNVTTIKPPDDIPKKNLVFNEKEQKWEYKTVYIGEYIYLKEGGYKSLNEVHIFELPDTYTLKPPPVVAENLTISYLKFDDNKEDWIVDRSALEEILRRATTTIVHRYYKPVKQRSDNVDFNSCLLKLSSRYGYDYNSILKDLDINTDKIISKEISIDEFIESKPEDERYLWEQLIKANIRFEFVNKCKECYKTKLQEILNLTDEEIFKIGDIFEYVCDIVENYTSDIINVLP